MYNNNNVKFGKYPYCTRGCSKQIIKTFLVKMVFSNEFNKHCKQYVEFIT